MIFYIDEGRLVKSDTNPHERLDFRPCLCIFNREELLRHGTSLLIEQRILDDCLNGQTSRFESHEGFDFMSLTIPLPEDPIESDYHVNIYFRHNLLVFACEDLEKAYALHKLYSLIADEEDEIRSLTLEKVLQLFFDHLTYADSLILEDIQEEATLVEEALITAKSRDYTSDIIRLRKKLLAYKRYYNQLSAISSAIEENGNALLPKKELRSFHILTGRVERLRAEIEDLQDYVSQVREAYQTQVDIDQNSVMKLFTTITAIFLPLTLIVGWYGMNLKMPEYGWASAYPAVILVSLIVAFGSFLYFKRNKWF